MREREGKGLRGARHMLGTAAIIPGSLDYRSMRSVVCAHARMRACAAGCVHSRTQESHERAGVRFRHRGWAVLAPAPLACVLKYTRYCGRVDETPL